MATDRLGAIVLVEIWMDVVCPWCCIGKRQFETALAWFPYREDVDVVLRSLQLDPLASQRQELPLIELMKHKYSMSDQQAWEANDRITKPPLRCASTTTPWTPREAIPSTLIG